MLLQAALIALKAHMFLNFESDNSILCLKAKLQREELIYIHQFLKGMYSMM